MRIAAGVTTGELAQYITDHAVSTHMMRKANSVALPYIQPPHDCSTADCSHALPLQSCTVFLVQANLCILLAATKPMYIASCAIINGKTGAWRCLLILCLCPPNIQPPTNSCAIFNGKAGAARHGLLACLNSCLHSIT